MFTFRRAAGRTVVLCGAMVAAIALQTLPASAHATTIVLGANRGSVNASHNQVTVCDNENDGASVYAQFQVSPWGLPTRYYDSYGGGCSTHALTVSRFTVRWSLCEVNGACASALL